MATPEYQHRALKCSSKKATYRGKYNFCNRLVRWHQPNRNHRRRQTTLHRAALYRTKRSHRFTVFIRLVRPMAQTKAATPHRPLIPTIFTIRTCLYTIHRDFMITMAISMWIVCIPLLRFATPLGSFSILLLFSPFVVGYIHECALCTIHITCCSAVSAYET